MSESSQNDQPVIFWISIPPTGGNSGDPVGVPPIGGPSQHGAPLPAPGPATSPPRRPGVFIPYIVLQVLAVLTVGGVAGLLIVLQWPQASAALGTICAITGAGLAVFDIMMRRDRNGGSGDDQG
jgi:hypothetical protein